MNMNIPTSPTVCGNSGLVCQGMDLFQKADYICEQLESLSYNVYGYNVPKATNTQGVNPTCEPNMREILDNIQNKINYAEELIRMLKEVI